MHTKRLQTGRARTRILLFAILLSALLVTGCSGLVELFEKARDVKTVRPSGVIVTETRDVRGFTGLDIRTVGQVVLTQGNEESLTISGSDNLVPLVVTQVDDGVLIIGMQEGTVIASVDSDVLTFDIVLPDLSQLTVSGMASVQMEDLTTSDLQVTMSGAGEAKIGDLRASTVDITVSGLGGVEIAGQVTRQSITISGAGEVRNADLECERAEVNVPGLGSATIWVTGELAGKINGAGSVRYYGAPTTDTESTGVGRFEALGEK